MRLKRGSKAWKLREAVRRDALLFKCDTCRAGVAAPCKTRNGKLRKPHLKRSTGIR